MWEAQFDPIRNDARVRKVLDEMGLTEAHARAQAWRVKQAAAGQRTGDRGQRTGVQPAKK